MVSQRKISWMQKETIQKWAAERGRKYMNKYPWLSEPFSYHAIRKKIKLCFTLFLMARIQFTAPFCALIKF